MSETHIAHAVATFSELGIAASIVWLSDVVKFRSALEKEFAVADYTHRIASDDYIEKSNGFSGVLRILIRVWMPIRKLIYTGVIGFLLWLLHRSSFICLAFGIFALMGISFYPSACSFTPAFLIYDHKTLDKIYLGMSFLSFLVVCLPLLPRLTSAVINKYVIKTIPIE